MSFDDQCIPIVILFPSDVLFESSEFHYFAVTCSYALNYNLYNSHCLAYTPRLPDAALGDPPAGVEPQLSNEGANRDRHGGRSPVRVGVHETRIQL